jgi:chromosome segregation ATPase
MTRSRYFLAKLAQAFGLSFASRYATNAATETHLLREAEEVLGRLCWEDLENLEDLSVEYWNLRKLAKRHAELSTEINQANNVLVQSHEDRSGLLDKVAENTKDLVEEREKLVENSERLKSDRDAILREARLIKRRHDGLKAKLEVLAAEGQSDPAAVEAAHHDLNELKSQFTSLKTRRDELSQEIETLEKTIEAKAEHIETRRKTLREEALGSYQSIGKANKDISACRAELGNVEKEMCALFCEVGRFVSVNTQHQECRAATKTHRSLINQMTALRQSVTMNNHLAGRGAPPGATA